MLITFVIQVVIHDDTVLLQFLITEYVTEYDNRKAEDYFKINKYQTVKVAFFSVFILFWKL